MDKELILMTVLQKIQKEIDRCNGKCGCNSKCSRSQQEECYLLKKHRERISYCSEKDLPIERW